MQFLQEFNGSESFERSINMFLIKKKGASMCCLQLIFLRKLVLKISRIFGLPVR